MGKALHLAIQLDSMIVPADMMEKVLYLGTQLDSMTVPANTKAKSKNENCLQKTQI